jgi:diacylglycerol kinase (CTP)
VGIKYGEDKIFENKSLQGTVTCFAVCYVLTLAAGLYIGNGSVELLTFALLAGMMGAVSELMSVWVDDNFSIPVVSGLGLTLLNFGFQIF